MVSNGPMPSNIEILGSRVIDLAGIEGTEVISEPPEGISSHGGFKRGHLAKSG
jgi:hypothetical protein